MPTLLDFGESPAALYGRDQSHPSATIASFEVPAGTQALYFGVTYQSGSVQPTGISWDGDTSPTRIGSRLSLGTGSYWSELWKLVGPTPGTGDIVLSMSGNAFALRVVVWAVKDIDLADDIGIMVAQTGAASDLPYTPEADGSLLLAVSLQSNHTRGLLTTLPSGWVIDETAVAFHGNTAASATSGFSHKDGTSEGVQEPWSQEWADESTGGSVLMIEVRHGESGGTDATATPSGVEATASVGTVQVNLSPTVSVSGLEATASVGTVDIEATISATASPAGVEASGHVGTVSTLAGAVAAPAGVSGQGETGSVSVTFGGTATVEGVQGSGAVGTVSVSAGANDNAAPDGVAGTGAVGTVSIALDSTSTPAGVEASGEVGEVLAGSGTGAAVSGVSGSGQVGTATVTTDASISVSGVEGTGSVGAVSIAASVIVTLSGVAATGSVGDATAFEAPAVTMGRVSVTQSAVTAITASIRLAANVSGAEQEVTDITAGEAA